MKTLNVQFTDSTEATIKSYFASAQDPDLWPNFGTVASSDARWSTFYGEQPVYVQIGLPSPTGD